MRRSLLLLAFLVLPSLCAAQVRPIAYKDPSTAVAIAFLIPGGGHIYAGESGKGWTLATVGVGSLAGGLALALRCEESTETFPGGGTSTTRDCGPRTTPLAIGATVFAVTWIIGLTDAGPAARRANTRHGLAFAPIVGPSRDGTTVALRVAF